MQKLYSDTKKLDMSCRAAYGLTEEVMMENAAFALEAVVRNPTPISKDRRQPMKVLILCGGGNNGADGYALARRLRFDYDVNLIQFCPPKTELCRIQSERADKCGVRFVKRDDLSFYDLRYADIIVDCVFGSGFHDDLDEKTAATMEDMNSCSCLKIACDVPTGLRADGTVSPGAFLADVTVTMGALKACLFSDYAKDYVGEIKIGELGVNKRLYENSGSSNLTVGHVLEPSDLELPHRKKNNVNKGNFGHVAVVCGEKSGAACLSGCASLRFGAGLVTLVCNDNQKKDFESFPELMTSLSIPEKVNSIAFGMGLGRDNSAQTYFDFLLKNPDVKCVVDADAFYCEGIYDFLTKREGDVVLTPHPKEFQVLLKICGFGDFSIEDCKIKRIELLESFCRKFPKKALVLKGATPLIGYFDGHKYQMFANPLGEPCLAKGGSGDVLTGMTAALLAQNYNSLEAAINASLAHALASKKIKCDYAMTPFDLINATAEL